jgi:hypothetical protein
MNTLSWNYDLPYCAKVVTRSLFLEIFLQYCLISGPRPPMQPGRWPIDLIGQRMGGGGVEGERWRDSATERCFPMVAGIGCIGWANTTGILSFLRCMMGPIYFNWRHLIPSLSLSSFLVSLLDIALSSPQTFFTVFRIRKIFSRI